MKRYYRYNDEYLEGGMGVLQLFILAEVEVNSKKNSALLMFEDIQVFIWILPRKIK